MKRAFDIGKYHSNGQRIGSGAYSDVYKGCDTELGIPIAIKVVDLYHLTSREPHKKEKLTTRLKSEIRIAKNVDHPNLVQLLDVFKKEEKVYLIFEFCDKGDLGHFLKERGPLSEAEAQHYMNQIVAGMQYLSENNIVHRDLKPQNLLLQRIPASPSGTADTPPLYRLKIADFGFAKQTEPDILSETICGSPLYMAPELLNRKPYSSKADLWSLGVILYEMVTGLQPITAKSQLELVQNIQHQRIKIPSCLSQECKELLMGLLRRKADGRMSMEELVGHPFLVKEVDFQEQTKEYSTTEPIGIPSPPRISTTLSRSPHSPFPQSPFTSSTFSSSRSHFSGSHVFHSPQLFDSPSPIKSREVYERYHGIEEIYVLTTTLYTPEITFFVYFHLLIMLLDFVDTIQKRLHSKELRPSRKIAHILKNSISLYESVRNAALELEGDVDVHEKVPSFPKVVFERVILLEQQADDPQIEPKKAYKCINSAIILLLALQNSQEERINKARISKEIARFLKKKKLLKKSFTSSLSFGR